MGLIGGLGEGVGRRHGSAAWGLGRLGPVTLRPAEGHKLGDGAWGDRRWGMAWVSELGQRNRLVMRELVDELRDEGDEGAGRRAREKKKIKEERKKKRSQRERERKGNVYLMREEREV